MKIAQKLIILACFVALSAAAGMAQETEVKVIDEVVAEVNEGVITLSRIKRESKELVDARVNTGSKREDAQKEVDEKQGQIIADLINQELLTQRSKEIGIDKEVESAINQRLVDIMKQQNFKSIEELEGAMRAQNIDPQEMRAIWRKQLTTDRVLQYEVDRNIYWGLKSKELKDYYEKNKEKFLKPEMISLSEIFLDFSKGDPGAKREKARSLVAQLRSGADFIKIVTEHSERPDAAATKGKTETLRVKELDPKFGVPLKDVKVGGVTDPIELDNVGILILRVDERIAAGTTPEFDENAVRLAITNERRADATKKYMSKLREDAHIRVNEKYRPIVSPLLFADERRAKATN
jgi:hypothetical protein